MFNLNSAYKSITLDEIYSKVTEYQLWKYYCPSFKDCNTSFKSELYNDNNPGCRITEITNNRFLYRDYGTGNNYGIFDYIQVKYNVTFKEALNIVSNDFNLRSKVPITIDNTIKQLNVQEKLLYRPKTKIDIIPQSYNIVDYNYWKQIYLDLDFLNKEEIISCKHVYLTIGDKTLRYDSHKNNPIYAWKEYDIDLNFLGYKIYAPYSSSKWLNNAGSKAIQGIKTLKYDSNLLIITKSRKDVLVLTMLGYNAISLASENVKLDRETYDILNSKYDKIISLYDQDDTGLQGSNYLSDTYNIEPFNVPLESNCKDISDYLKINGLKKTKEMLNNLIYE